MATLRIRLRVNPGRSGSPMDKLGEFATQTERFLRSLSRDFGIEADKGKWLARKFTNDSVAFDGEYSDSVDDAVANKAYKALSVISGSSPIEACNTGLIGFGTLAEFAKIGRVLDADEFFYIGLYNDGQDEPQEWKPVSHKQTTEIRKLLETPIESLGSLQGVLHSWHQGSDPQFFQVRELITGMLVRCEYDGALHSKVHAASRIPNTVIHVYGRMYWDPVSNATIRVVVEDIESTERLSDLEFEKFFGAAPQYTGDLSTTEYLAWLRGDEE